MRAVLSLLLALLATAPVHAGWFGPTAVHLAPYREGDLLRYEEGDAEAGTTLLVRYEGYGRAVDAYGVERDAAAFRSERSDAERLQRAQVCHVAEDGEEVVRVDVLAGGGTGSWSSSWDSKVGDVTLRRGSLAYEESVVVQFESCDWRPALRTSFAEGDRVPVVDLFPSASSAGIPLSAPARASTFHGHDALDLVFDVDGAVATVTVAEGFPAPVKVTAREAGKDEVVFLELTAFRPGGGEPFVAASRPPTPPPATARAPYERLGLDDAAFAPDYPFAEAFEALRSDARTGVSEWIVAHPDAVVSIAYYTRGAVHGGEAPGSESDGSWYVVLADSAGARAWSSYRSRLPGDPGVAFPGPVRPGVQNFAFDVEDGALDRPVRTDAPPVVASGDVARVAAAHGVPLDTVVLLGYNLFVDEDGTPRGFFSVSDVALGGEGAKDGREVWVHAQTGKASGVALTSKRGETNGLLALGEGEGDLETAARSSPGVLSLASGTGLAAGTVTGVALLALLVKFVFLPLYTRLRRDRLLDNPLRARLYEHVRREPGVHQADLVDLAGVGKGATKHHLDQLVRHRLLVALEGEGFTRYFAAGEVPPDVARREAVLRAGSLRVVYDLYAAEPGISLRDAGARLGLSAPSVFRARRKLEKEGLLPAAPTAEVRP